MLTVAPPHFTSDEQALMVVARWWQRTDWDRVGVCIVAVFYLWLSLTLLLAPDRQVITQGSRAAFELLPPEAWAAGFFVGGLAAVTLAWSVTGVRQALAWLLIFPAQTVWLGASVIAVLQGGGSAIGVVLWAVILAFTALTAIRLGIAFTSGKR